MQTQWKKLTGYFFAKKMRFSNEINPPPLWTMIRSSVLTKLNSSKNKEYAIECVKIRVQGTIGRSRLRLRNILSKVVFLEIFF